MRVFAQERRHERVFSGLNDENRVANMKTVNLNAAYFPAVELLSSLVTAGILLYGGLQAIDGDVTVGVLVAFIAALNNFFDPIQQLSQLYTTYQAGMAALDKIFELLDEEPELTDRPGAIALPRLRGELAFDGVTFAYAPGGEPALDGIDLHVPPGQTVALVGSTGRGQVDVRQARRALLRPDGRADPASTATTCATCRRARCARRWGSCRRRRSCSAARSARTSPSGAPTRRSRRSRRRPRAVGAHDFIAALEHGYDTEVGERGIQLSAGQRQLVAFTRALISDPRILVLDEATSNVDIHTESRIEEGMRRLLAGRTAIVIAHRLSTIRGAGPHRRARPRPDRRAGHARRAARRRGRLLAAVPRLGRAGRRGLSSERLALAHARVEPALDRVAEEVRHDDEQRRLDHERLDEVDVAVHERALDVAERARDVEHRLDQREVRERSGSC